MADKPQKTYPPTLVPHILLGEAAGEGPEGLAMVADTLWNRAHALGKTLEEVATAPSQFSAATRPDLDEFAEQQPLDLRVLANELVAERRNPKFQPSHPYQHYVATALWERRGTLPANHWLRKMRKVGQVGNHVLLEEVPH